MQVWTESLQLGAVVSDACLNESLTATRAWLPEPSDRAFCICTCTCPAFPLRQWMGWWALEDGKGFGMKLWYRDENSYLKHFACSRTQQTESGIWLSRLRTSSFYSFRSPDLHSGSLSPDLRLRDGIWDSPRELWEITVHCGLCTPYPSLYLILLLSEMQQPYS